MIIGKLPNGSYGIQAYKSDGQFKYFLTHTKAGKPRKPFTGKRLNDLLERYAEFKIEKIRNEN